MNNLDYFAELGHKALDETCDIRIAEKYYLMALVEIYKLGKSDKLIDYFFDLVEHPDTPHEFVSFCMRSLQWNEIKERLYSLLEKAEDPRDMTVYRSMLSVYETSWVGSELYEYYLVETSG